MKSFLRFLHISSKVIPPFVRLTIYRKNSDSEKYKKAAADIRLAFQDLGATFIKLGQLLSARPDIVGPQLADELRNLLDKQNPISFDTVKHTIKEELESDIPDIFASFEKEPVSTASIGQVHRAKLKNNNIVAVKVQREGLVFSIKRDLKLFGKVAKVMDSLLPSKGISFSYIYKEFSEWINNELDFKVEAKRSEKFAENLGDIDGIKIPKVYWKYTTQKIMVTEFLDGITINGILREQKEQRAESVYELKGFSNLNFDLMIRNIIDALVKQIFVDKFFHGDLHPANLIALGGGKVALVDFGIVGSLNDTEHTQILLTLLALIENDPKALVKLMLSFSTRNISAEQKAHLEQEFSRQLHRIHGGEAESASISHFVSSLLSVGRQYDIFWTSGLILAAKTLSQVDSIAIKFGLKDSVIDLIKPGIDKYIDRSFSAKFSKESIFKIALGLVEAGKRLPETISDLEKVLHEGLALNLNDEQISSRKSIKSYLKPILLLAIAATISLVIVNIPLIKNSDFQLVWTLFIPLIIYFILSKIV